LQVLLRDPADIGASTSDEFDQTFLSETFQRVTNRPAADSESFGDVHLEHPHSIGPGPVKDPSTEFIAHSRVQTISVDVGAFRHWKSHAILLESVTRSRAEQRVRRT
jgi:hypothetical protein